MRDFYERDGIIQIKGYFILDLHFCISISHLLCISKAMAIRKSTNAKLWYFTTRLTTLVAVQYSFTLIQQRLHFRSPICFVFLFPRSHVLHLKLPLLKACVFPLGLHFFLLVLRTDPISTNDIQTWKLHFTNYVFNSIQMVNGRSCNGTRFCIRF